MPVQRRKDTGAWEVVVPRPGMAPMRRSSARWTHADALAYERKLTSNHHTLEDGLCADNLRAAIDRLPLDT